MAGVTSISEWRERRDVPSHDRQEPCPGEVTDDGVTEFAPAAGAAGTSGPDLDRERQEVCGALSEFVFSEDEGWMLFEAAAAQGQIGLPERAGVLAEALQERGSAGDIPKHVLRNAIEALIPELALELLPESPAATWERLLARIREDAVIYEDPSGAIQRLAAADRRIFCSLTHLALTEPDQAALVATAREVWVELRRRGHDYEPRGFTDYVWTALRELFPDAPGAGWDSNWAASLYKKVYCDLSHHAHEAGVDTSATDTSRVEAAVDEMRNAESREDRIAFREAARRAVKVGRLAVREATSEYP